jgi:MFS family permease
MESTPLLDEETAPQSPQTPQSAPQSTLSPYSICIPIFISVFSVSLSIVSTQQWLLLFLCSRYDPEGTWISLITSAEMRRDPTWETCRVDTGVQALTAKWNMLLSLCTNLPALFSGPVWGALSDTIGRKPILVISPIGAVLNILAIFLISYFNFGLWAIVLSHCIRVD